MIGYVPELLIELAQLYDFTNQHKEAGVILRKALQQKPHSAKALYLMAWTHQSLGEYEQAIGFYWKFLEVEPEEISVLVPLVLCYEDLNLTEQAVALLDQASQLFPQLMHCNWRIIPQMDKLCRLVLKNRKAKERI